MTNLTLQRLKQGAKALGLSYASIVGHHYYGKLMDRQENLQASLLEETRFQTLNQKLDQHGKCSEAILEEVGIKKQVQPLLQKCSDNIDKTKECLDVGDITNTKPYNNSAIQCVDDMISIVSNKGNGSSFHIDLNTLYNYLDSLTLFQEAALFHLFVFGFIFITLISLAMTLFANEIINYFKLENLHPLIKKMLILRLKFQKYYFILNFALLFIVIIGASFLDFCAFNLRI